MTTLAICGVTGRMGRLLVERIAASPDIELAGGIALEEPAEQATAARAYPRVELPANAGPLLSSVDALIDFSSRDALSELLVTHGDALEGKALVIGTTGLDDEVDALLDRCADTSPVLVAANFSAGINLLLGLVETAARTLDAAEYDVEIVETHHAKKVDAPSGTALALADAAARARGQELAEVRRDGRSGVTGERPAGEIGIHALRGGAVPGEHRVMFFGAKERIELSHTATDRAVFADGALMAVRWLIGRPPGRYTMRQVLGL